MSEPTGKDSPAALSPAAELVIGHARKTAKANGRTVPSGEDLLLCLLIVGLMEEPFIDALTNANVSANDLRGEIIKLGHTRLEENGEQVAALKWHAAQFWEELGRRSAAGYDLDCCAFTAALLESEYLAQSTRKLVLSRGLTPDVLLHATTAGWRTRPEITPFESRDLAGLSECSCEAPPLGFSLDEVDLPELVGREAVLAQVARDFAAGKQVRITGPEGTGKSLLARVAAATSGRPAIWVSDEEVSSLPASERATLFPALVAYLREIGGGLVLTGLDSSAFTLSPAIRSAGASGKSALATALLAAPYGGGEMIGNAAASHAELALADLPLIVTVRNRQSSLPVSIAGPWTEVALRPLSKAKAAAALTAWNQESGRALVDEGTLAVSIDLATRFLGGEQALPGSAIALLKAATCAPVPKSLKSAPSNPPAVTLEGLEEAVCYLTGLPLAIVSDTERRRLAAFGDTLAQSLIGQRRAVDDVASAIVRHELSISANTRPIGSFLFVGPTGVGKTELARVLASERYGSADALVRFDMAEFFDRHEIARLIGSPPGYVGSNKDGQLIEAIKRRKDRGGVLLLDEIEKADNSLYDFFLAALDYGQVTASNSGEKVSLRKWIIIFTSNVGSGDGADARKRGVLGFAGAASDPTSRSAAARAKAVEGHFRSRSSTAWTRLSSSTI